MRKLLFYLVLLILAVFIGLAIVQAPSFVLFQFKSVSIALPIWLFMLLIILLIYLSFVIRKICRILFIAPQKFKSNLDQMQQRREVKRQMREIRKKIERTKIS
jgi:uncharacterized protein HemY